MSRDWKAYALIERLCPFPLYKKREDMQTPVNNSLNFTEDEILDAVEDFQNGIPINQIADRLRVPNLKIRYWAKNYANALKTREKRRREERNAREREREREKEALHIIRMATPIPEPMPAKALIAQFPQVQSQINKFIERWEEDTPEPQESQKEEEDEALAPEEEQEPTAIKKGYTAEFREKIIQEALKDGSNISRLIEKYDLSRSTVYKWIKNYKEQNSEEGYYPMVVTKHSEELKINAVKRVLSGESKNSIAKELGIGNGTIYYWMEKYAPEGKILPEYQKFLTTPILKKGSPPPVELSAPIPPPPLLSSVKIEGDYIVIKIPKRELTREILHGSGLF